MTSQLTTPTSTDAYDAAYGEKFRRAMGRIPTGVSVITSELGGERIGMTVGSLTHVSLDPPLLVFFAQRSSLTAVAIIEAGRFGVNLLTRGQDAECYRFASSKGAKFEGLQVDVSESGLPRLQGTALWAECEVQSVVDAGDHVGIFGRVSDYDVADRHGPPMAFYRSKLTTFDPASGRHIPTEALHWW